MATLPTIDSGRMQLAQVSGAQLPTIQMPMVNPIGAQVAASGANMLANALNQMETFAFGRAKELQAVAAEQFAVENPISDEQLKALANGQPIEAYMGGAGGNVFDAVVAKARGLELAAHFKAEGRVQYAKILDDVKAGRMTAEDARSKMNVISNGLMKPLSINPDAAFQVKADLATFGSTIYKAALDSDANRVKQQRIALIDASANALTAGLEEAYSQGFWIDSKGQKRNVSDVSESFKQSVLNDALVLGDADLQQKYAKQFIEADRAAKISAVLKYTNTPDNIVNPQVTQRSIRTGNLGKMSDVAKELNLKDEKAVEEIEKRFMEYVGRQTTLEKERVAEEKRVNENMTKDLFAEYYTPTTKASRKKEIVNQLIGLRTLTPDQMETLLDPSKKPGDPYVFASLEYQIRRGDIREFDDLKRLSLRNGMNGAQFERLTAMLTAPFNQEKANGHRLLRQASGVPDVQSMFTSKDDEHKMVKNQKLEQLYESGIKNFMEKNPSARIPYDDLARSVIEQYNNTDRADASKDQARKKIASTMKDLETKKSVPAGMSVDENTDLDAMQKKYKLKDDDINYLRKHQRVLRGEK